MAKELEKEELPKLESISSVVVTREQAPFAPAEQLGEYVLERWTWREKMLATTKATKIVDKIRNILAWDTVIWYEQMLLLTVKRPPTGTWDIDVIRKLDADVGDILQNRCLDLNTVSAVDKKSFLQPSNSENPTPGSNSIGPASPSTASPKKADS